MFAALLLVFVRLMIALRGVRPLLKGFTPVPAASPVAADAALEARRIGALVARTAARIPGTRRCLVQAFAASILLRHRQLAHELVLGALPDRRSLKAHAWIVSGGEIVVGAGPMTSLPTIAIFRSRGEER